MSAEKVSIVSAGGLTLETERVM